MFEPAVFTHTVVLIIMLVLNFVVISALLFFAFKSLYKDYKDWREFKAIEEKMNKMNGIHENNT